MIGPASFEVHRKVVEPQSTWFRDNLPEERTVRETSAIKIGLVMPGYLPSTEGRTGRAASRTPGEIGRGYRARARVHVHQG